jgi:hypothetical protein
MVEPAAPKARHAGSPGSRRCRTPEHAEDADHEAKVAHAVDHEGLHRGGVGAGLAEPEADQQVRGQTHAFPAEEHLHQVVRRHQHEHGEGEQRQIGEEARLIRLLAHVPPRIEVHEERDAGDHHQHDRGERVDPQRPEEIEIARLHPLQHRGDAGFRVATQERQEDRPRQRAGNEQRAGGDHLGRDQAEFLVAKAGNDRCQKRQEDDDVDGRHGFSPSSG